MDNCLYCDDAAGTCTECDAEYILTENACTGKQYILIYMVILLVILFITIPNKCFISYSLFPGIISVTNVQTSPNIPETLKPCKTNAGVINSCWILCKSGSSLTFKLGLKPKDQSPILTFTGFLTHFEALEPIIRET